MISDTERHKIAAKLRETCDEIERTGNGLTVWELTDVLNIRDDDSGIIESLNLDDARNLADLIDRPTCHIRETDHEFEDSVRCDRCQMTFNRPWAPFKHCPNCGAEVVG